MFNVEIEKLNVEKLQGALDHAKIKNLEEIERVETPN